MRSIQELIKIIPSGVGGLYYFAKEQILENSKGQRMENVTLSEVEKLDKAISILQSNGIYKLPIICFDNTASK